MNKTFGVSYNVFDGEELLKDSILSIRDSVDYISVVYQVISNHGNKCSGNLLPILMDLKDSKLVDELYEYKPKLNLTPHFNEINKRNIGYFLSMENGIDYHMSSDSDEFYLKDEFTSMKQKYIDDDLDSGYCQMLTYYKSKLYVLDPPEDYYVSLFYKINEYNNYYFHAQLPVLVDPTRRMEPGKFHIFSRDVIQMHHMSYIRDDIRSKFINSSANSNFKNIDKTVEYFNNWTEGNDAMMMSKEIKIYKTKKVNYFK